MHTLWLWDKQKAAANVHKHGVSFELARIVFKDVYSLSVPDPHIDGDRWRTMGLVGPIVLFVVHTVPEYDAEHGMDVGRIISARKATASERRVYEDG